MKFDEFGLSEELLASIKAAGYETPTPIQEKAIPPALQTRDVLGIAQTGTGKTAGFSLPLIERLSRGRARARMPRSLILLPTRELAAQVSENIEIFTANHKLTMALLIGGVSFDEQNKKLDRGVDILIATPGRLLDHFERGRLMLSGTEVFVIDEADRMLDMGFIPDIERIFSLLPFTRQTLFFSATMPPEIQKLTDRFLHNAVRVEVSAPASTADTVTQARVTVANPNKREALRRVIRNEEVVNGIVFCNTKRSVDILNKSLQKHGFQAGALHGDLDQHLRMRILDGFKNGDIQFLVASDVAARGLDIPAVSHVFNFDIPTHAEDYVHRIGRTGRAGRSGRAITICTPHDDKYLDAVQKLIGQEIAILEDLDLTELLQVSDEDGNGRRGARRGRRSKDAESSDEKRSTKRSRGRREAPVEEREEETERPARRERTKDRGERSDQRNDRGRERGGRRRHREEQDEPVVGLGDHVPAFLLRPVVLPSAKTKSPSEGARPEADTSDEPAAEPEKSAA